MAVWNFSPFSCEPSARAVCTCVQRSGTMFSRFGLSSVLRPAARALSTSVAQAPRIKHKIPRKRYYIIESSLAKLTIRLLCCITRRASSLLSILQNEEYTRLKNGRQWEKILPGDSVEIEKVPFTTSSEVEVVKGVVIGLTNKLGDSRIRILNVSHFGVSQTVAWLLIQWSSAVVVRVRYPSGEEPVHVQPSDQERQGLAESVHP